MKTEIKTKNWALVVAALYFLALAALTAPAIALAFCTGKNGIHFGEAFAVYGMWPYWVWLAVMVLGQAALLALPVRLASRRPVTRGSLVPPVIATGLMTGGLLVGAVLSLLEFVYADKGIKDRAGWLTLGAGAALWIGWSIVFYRTSRREDPGDVLTRQCRWLLKGSVLELLIAVPTHIVARSRDYCCAGIMTFVGLTMGISVMLFSFGPAVFFLLLARWRRLHPEPGR